MQTGTSKRSCVTKNKSVSSSNNNTHYHASLGQENKKSPFSFLEERIRIPVIKIALPIWSIGVILLFLLTGVLLLNFRQQAYKNRIKKASQVDKKIIQQQYNTTSLRDQYLNTQDDDATLPPTTYTSSPSNNPSHQYPSSHTNHVQAQEDISWNQVASKILPYLILTGKEGMYRVVQQKKYTSQPVTHVISLKSTPVKIDPHLIAQKNHLYIQIDDEPNANLLEQFEHIISYIDQAKAEYKNNTLIVVHCEMGISRSSTAVIAYLMVHYKMQLNDALHYVRTIRPIVEPNPGFYHQLEQFQSILSQPPL